MKNITNFIFEKLKLNSQSKLKHDWTIEDAKEGDIITIQLKEGNKKIYIFRSIEKVPNIGYKGIKMYCFYDYEEGHFFIIPEDSGSVMGYLKDYEDPNVLTYWKSTDKEKRIFFDAMKERGYKWNERRKTISKIKK